MSTPISSSSSSAGLQGTPISPATSGSASPTKSSQLKLLSGTTTLLPEAMLASLQAAASVSQLELAFGQVMKNATPVDPSTGKQEVSASADSQLSAALNSFLVQSGFSQQQADAASTGFAAQLAKGGPVDLNASFDETSTIASSMSASYGSLTMSASSVAVNERSGSVSIEFDPTTGSLSISLGEQQTSTTQSITETTGPAPLLALSPTNMAAMLAGQGQDSNADGNGTLNDQRLAAAPNHTAASSNSNNSVQGMIAELGLPKLLGLQEALDSLSRMAKAAQPDVAATTSSSTPADLSQDQPAAATIGFTQPLSIAMHDLNGHGTTLFKRPDGSTGAMSFEPTNVVA
jgi:hypothetical protein